MYAIVDVAGQQFKVEKGHKIFVNRLEIKEGDNLAIDKVLLIENDGKIIIGQPLVKGALVTAKVLGHPRGDKVMVFKKKRRKGFRVKNGYRSDLTQLLIEEIEEKASPKKASPAKTAGKMATGKPVSSTTEKSEVKKTAKAVNDQTLKEEKAVPGKTTIKAAPKAAPVKKKTVATKKTAVKSASAKKSDKTQPASSAVKSKNPTTAKKPITKPAAKKSPKGTAKKDEK